MMYGYIDMLHCRLMRPILGGLLGMVSERMDYGFQLGGLDVYCVAFLLLFSFFS